VAGAALADEQPAPAVVGLGAGERAAYALLLSNRLRQRDAAEMRMLEGQLRAH